VRPAVRPSDSVLDRAGLSIQVGQRLPVVAT